MNKIAQDSVSATVATVIGGWLLKIDLISWPALVLLLFAIVVLLGIKIWRLTTAPSPISSVLGVELGESDHSIDLAALIKSCDSSFYFLGISSNRTTNNNELLAALAELSHKRGDIRFLLLNPASPNLARRAADELAEPDTWSHDILATVARIKSAAKARNANVQIKYYDDYPVWRMIVCDRQRIRLNYYLPRLRFTDSQTLSVVQRPGGIQHSFLAYFDELWAKATPAT